MPGEDATAKVPPELRGSTDPLIGRTIGPCRIEALVGKGGMGAVYRGRHLKLERPVAVKLLAAAGEQAVAAALAEARAAARLDDPRIVGIHEVGEDGGRPYIVMQWIEGESLEDRVARAGPLAPDQALAVMKETLAALAAAHEAGLVHRDVKPGNILLPAKGGVKLADFGLAVSAGGGADGDPVGTFLFMAPEQGYGHAADARADLYAVGGTWYYALTGKPPFGTRATEAILRHREEAPPDPREGREDVSRKNAELILRLLAKDPAARPAGAAEALKECSAFGFLVETSSLGDSPFALKAPPPMPKSAPPPPPPPAPAAPSAPAPAHGAVGSVMPGGAREPIGPLAPRAMPAPPPPPPAPADTGGSRLVFAVILAVLVVAAVGGSFRKAGQADWVAASLYLHLLLAALTWGERLRPWRKGAGALAWLGALACAGVYAGARASSVEAMSLAGLGAASGAAALYLGLWGQDREEALWARGLAPAAGLMLAAAALTWGAPDAPSWTQALALRGRETLSVFTATAGPWRWLGAAVLTAALAVVAKMKSPPPSAAPTDRTLNWNR